jgi:glycosyltransferase involved in cell wall biosynthesis
LCKLYVFPSWHEGFGLPALEAMACGAPVIGANTSSLPEVIGCEDALFDPFDVNSISAKIEHALTDDEFRDNLRVHGLSQAKLFSWDKTAQLAIRAFERIPKHHELNCFDSALVIKQLTKRVSDISDGKVTDSDLRELAYAIDQNLPEKASRQIFVDISELVQCDAKTGVQRVTRAILQQLLLAPPAGYVVQPVYASIDKPGYRYARKYMQAFGDPVANSEDEPIVTQPGDIFLGLDLQHHTTRVQEQYLSVARQKGVAVHFVIYDLLPIQFPDYWPEQHSVDRVHRDWLYVICKFDGVICISRAVADELQAWLKENSPPRLRPLAINWFHLGADVDNSMPSKGMPSNANDVLNLINSRPAFLNVGTIEPRKGQAQTLAAFEVLWQAGVDINLVFVGKLGWMMEALAENIRSHSELGRRLFWLEGISDEYLEAVYMASTCLIASSEGEGFGLPLIEAAQHKLPIIARDIPVFREVAGNHASYFSGFEAVDLAVVISSWLDDKKKGVAIKSDQLPWLTWQESASQLLANIIKDSSGKNP